MKFLIVDSNNARFSGLQKMLLQCKLDQMPSVLRAASLVQAFKVAETTHVDFIFMNCSGFKNAPTLIRQLRTMVGTIPIVALMARSQEKLADEMIKAGADDCAGHSE